MRPIYETDQDKEKELATLKIVASSWNCTYRQTKPLAPYDGYLFRDKKLKAIVEIKNRNILSFDPNPYYQISYAKLKNIISYAEKLKLNAYLVVNFLDSIEYVEITEENIDDVVIGGRSDRKDKLDIEEMACIHIDRFKTIYRKRINE